MIHFILKQVLFILGVSEPTDISENKQLFLNLKAREGQHYSLFSDKTAISGGERCYFLKRVPFCMEIILPRTEIPETSNINEYQPFY